MAKYKTYISSPTTSKKEILLLGIDSASIVAKLESNEVYYISSLDGSFKVKNGTKFLDSFTIIYDLVKGSNRCDEILLELFEHCDGDYKLLHTGIIEAKNVKLFPSKCFAEFKVSSNDLYSCLKKNWKEKVNHYEVAQHEISLNPPNATIEEKDIIGFNPSAYTNYCVKSTVFNPASFQIETTYWRQVVTVPNGIELNGWTVLEQTETETTYWRCPIDLGGSQIDTFKNGRYYKDVLEYTIVETLQKCTSKPVTVKSNFLGLNPSGFSPSNIAYENSTKYHDLLMFQMSDIVHYDYSESAGSTGQTQQFESTLEDLFKINQNLFQLAYRIDETDTEVIFRVEHISYFTLDSEIKDMRQEFGANEYSHNSTLPQRLKFKVQNSKGNDFIGTDIVFPSSCTDGEKNYTLSKISTDLAYLVARTKNSEGVYEANSDINLAENFALIAVDKILDKLFVAYETGKITNQGQYNAPMSFANLHAYFWLDNASAWTGFFNNQAQTFETVKFGIEAATVRKKFCCGDSLNENAIYYSKSSDEQGLTKKAQLKEFRLNLKTRTAEYKFIHGNT